MRAAVESLLRMTSVCSFTAEPVFSLPTQKFLTVTFSNKPSPIAPDSIRKLWLYECRCANVSARRQPPSSLVAASSFLCFRVCPASVSAVSSLSPLVDQATHQRTPLQSWSWLLVNTSGCVLHRWGLMSQG